jgi:hypothetical protein
MFCIQISNSGMYVFFVVFCSVGKLRKPCVCNIYVETFEFSRGRTHVNSIAFFITLISQGRCDG